jgi:hypothetical protein
MQFPEAFSLLFGMKRQFPSFPDLAEVEVSTISFMHLYLGGCVLSTVHITCSSQKEA